MFEELTEKKSHMSQFLRLDLGPMSYINAKQSGELYLGNIPNVLELEQKAHPDLWFWAVLNCTDDPGLDHLNSTPNFDVLRLNHLDGEMYSPDRITQGLQFIEKNLQAGVNTLVCCHAGVSRSPGVIIAYLMYKGWSYNEAVSEVRKSRPFIQIHPKIDLSIRQYFKLAPRTVADLIPGPTTTGY